MATLVSFTVSQSDCTGRAARRVLFNAETFKATKLSTGDVVAIYSPTHAHEFAVGIAWPSFDLPAQCTRRLQGKLLF
jgi:AAA family ATPase